MLIQFSATNFQCLKEKTTLDMQAVTLSEYKRSLINNRLLPLAAIYGPNGGGKTTLLKAFFTFQALIARHFNNIGGVIVPNEAPFGVQIIPFKFDKDSLLKPTDFEVFLEIGEMEYKYTVSVLNNRIVYEALYMMKVGYKVSKLVFERNETGINLGNVAKEIKIPENIGEGVLLLAWIRLIYPSFEPVANVANWFLSTYGVDFNNPFQEEILIYNIHQLELGSDERRQRIKNKVKELLAGMDLNIKSYSAKKIPINEHQFRIQINTEHKIGENSYQLDLNEESNGTKKIFNLLPLFVVALENGSAIVIDELDAKMHPLVLKYIINLFVDKKTNPKGAQLIFTSHDLTTMVKEVFRRDEIWFMAMNEKEYSSLYSLIEIRGEDGEVVRPDAVYNKQYLEGRYGADPYLNAIKHWGS